MKLLLRVLAGPLLALALAFPAHAQRLGDDCAPGRVKCGTDNCCRAGEQCSADGFCIPPGGSYCGGGRSCPMGQVCADGGTRCVPAGSPRCADGSLCPPGRACAPGGGCRPNFVPDLARPPGATGTPGCLPGGGCSPPGWFQCPETGSECRPGFKCSAGRGCVPRLAVDCGNGRWCRPGETCLASGGCAPAAESTD